ncbi:MAG: aspartate kinase [Sphingobacteriales bacterium]|nr:MAG: aspartate kinase [Sphingobacteriales bacterium]
MQVFKFGGASVKDAPSVLNVANILNSYTGLPLVVVISAMGKTTNALEDVVNAYTQETGQAKILLDKVRNAHFSTADTLFDGNRNHTVYAEMEFLLKHVEEILDNKPLADYNFIYDQIVSLGELLATKLVSSYLNFAGISNEWLDVRQCIKTDNTWREANIQWEVSNWQVREKVLPLLNDNKMVITQGFIGATIEYFTTTLGREGSDYTAAVFANILDAQSMTVWKDVPGILSADPRLVADAVKIPRLSYYEAVEMTYYGAQVIHPKTIKPLQNKKIPLIVQSFLAPDESGTIIHTEDSVDIASIPPIVVIKKNQMLLNVRSKDFSFIAEENLSNIYDLFAKHRVKANLSQNAAISFSACIDHITYKVEPLLKDLNTNYNERIFTNLELITIRHYTENTIKRFVNGREVLLEQKGKNTVQLVVRE